MIKLKDLIYEESDDFYKKYGFRLEDYAISKQEEQFCYTFLVRDILPELISYWSRQYYYRTDYITERSDRLFYFPEVKKEFKKVKDIRNKENLMDMVVWEYSKRIDAKVKKWIQITLTKDSNVGHNLIYHYKMKIDRTPHSKEGIHPIGKIPEL